MNTKQDLKSLALALFMMIVLVLAGYCAGSEGLLKERAKAKYYEQLFEDAIQIYGYEPADSLINNEPK